MNATTGSIVLFSGSSLPADDDVIAQAAELGGKLAHARIAITYGGGTKGLMGLVAQAALRNDGKVTGVTTRRYADELQPAGAQVVCVDTEQDRFSVFQKSNPLSYIALPGGPGTLREVWQALEGAVYDSGPSVILLDTQKGYLSGLKDVFDHSVNAGLIGRNHSKKLAVMNVDGILNSLKHR